MKTSQFLFMMLILCFGPSPAHAGAGSDSMEPFRNLVKQQDELREQNRNRCERAIREKSWRQQQLNFEELQALWKSKLRELKTIASSDCLYGIVQQESEEIYELTFMAAKLKHLKGERISSETEANDQLFGQLNFRGDANGIERTVTQFSSENLTKLYISAVQEQFSVLNVNVFGTTGKIVEGYPLHDGRHLFNSKSIKAREEIVTYTAIIHKIPDLEHEQKVAYEKMQMTAKLTGLKHQVFMASIAAIKNGRDFLADPDVQKLMSEFDSVVQSFRGNSRKLREEFLTDLLNSPEFKKETKEIAEELNFQRKWAQALTDTESMTLEEARHFFYLLGHYFRNAFHKEYVLWPKILYGQTKNIAGRQYIASDNKKVQIRFYISKTDEFIKNVFTEEIPLELARAWSVLKINSASDLPWATSMLQNFLSTNSIYFAPKGRDRLDAVANSLFSRMQNSSQINDQKYRPKFKSQFKATLENGETFTQNEVFKLRALDSNEFPLGIIDLEHNYDNQKIKLSYDRKTRFMTQTTDRVQSIHKISSPSFMAQYASNEHENIIGNVTMYSEYEHPIIRAINMIME